MPPTVPVEAQIERQSVENQEGSLFALTEQVVRLQALLEASKIVHSTIDAGEVLGHAARVAVLELEMEGAFFTSPYVVFGSVVGQESGRARFMLHSREGEAFSELVVVPPGGRQLTLYERDFLEGLALQTSVALENAINHKRHVEYARVEQDLDAARTIQQSLLPQVMPSLAGYTLAARSVACYHVGGDYLDIVEEAEGSYLMVVSDVAGKGLASALVCTAFRSAFRALATQGLALCDLAARLSQQHWEEGDQARRRYVTAIFLRLHVETGEVEMVNAGHNPAIVLSADGRERMVGSTGAPLGMLSGMEYADEPVQLEPGARILLYTDGLTELCRDDEEFGEDRLVEAFRAAGGCDGAEDGLNRLWARLEAFSGGSAQQDDMTAVMLCRHAGARKTGDR